MFKDLTERYSLLGKHGRPVLDPKGKLSLASTHVIHDLAGTLFYVRDLKGSGLVMGNKSFPFLPIDRFEGLHLPSTEEHAQKYILALYSSYTQMGYRYQK